MDIIASSTKSNESCRHCNRSDDNYGGRLGMRLDVDYETNLRWNPSNAGKAPLGPKSDYQSALILIEQGVQTCLMLRGEHKMLPMM